MRSWSLKTSSRFKEKKNSVRHLKAFSDFPLISPLRRDSGEQQFYCEEKQRASAAVRAGENGISDMHFVMKMSSSLGESVVFRSHVLQEALPLPFKAPFCNDDTLDDIHICKWEGGGRGLAILTQKLQPATAPNIYSIVVYFFRAVQNCILAGH